MRKCVEDLTASVATQLPFIKIDSHLIFLTYRMRLSISGVTVCLLLLLLCLLLQVLCIGRPRS